MMNQLSRAICIVGLSLLCQSAYAYNFITADCGNVNFGGGNMTFNYGTSLFSAEKVELTTAANRVTAFSDSSITIANQNDPSTANGNGQNEVFYDSSIGTAQCWYSWNTTSCNVVEADMQLGDEPWTTGEDSQHWPFNNSATGGRSVLGTGVHEWGHCIGMAHENTVYNMMGSDWTHVTRNSETTYYGPGEDLSAGLIVLHGERSGGSDNFRDVGATIFRYNGVSGEYSTHRFGVLRNPSSGNALPVVGSFSGQNTYQVVAGQTVQMELTLENNGEKNGETVNVGYYLSTNSVISSGDTLLRTINGYGLNRNTPFEITVNVTIPVDTAAGNYFLGAFADHDNLINETTALNNVAYYPISVLSAPSDLTVPAASVSDSTLRPGEAFTVQATVRNEGQGPSDSTTLRYYRSTNSIISASDTQIGTDAIPALNAGSQWVASDPDAAPGSEGTWWVGACVDSVPREANTGNNCSSGVQITVAIQSPTVTTNAVSQLGADRARLNATVTANGGNTTLYFDYGINNQFDNTLTYGSIGSGLTAVSANMMLNGLQCDTTYQVRARAVNTAGSNNGNVREFTTPTCTLFRDRFEDGSP